MTASTLEQAELHVRKDNALTLCVAFSSNFLMSSSILVLVYWCAGWYAGRICDSCDRCRLCEYSEGSAVDTTISVQSASKRTKKDDECMVGL